MSESSSIPSWAVKGAKVVCVDDSPTTLLGKRELVAGAIYTIAATRIERSGAPACKLNECARTLLGYDGADLVYFRLSRFRPLVTRTQEHDVAIFAPLLDRVPEAA